MIYQQFYKNTVIIRCNIFVFFGLPGTNFCKVTVYSPQLNCTYSNYTQAAVTCSAVQQHSTFTVQILYKLYSLQLNCTYSNYTQAAATCSAPQQHSTFTVQILCNECNIL